MKKIKELVSCHLSWVDAVVCFFLALAIPAANAYISNLEFSISLLFILKFILTFLILLFSTIFCRILISKIANFEAKKKSRLLKNIDRLFGSKHMLLLVAVVIFICWIPALIMLYPGTMINDSWGQLEQVLGLKSGVWFISAHHPVFDTFLMSGIIIPIAKLFNNWHIGMFFYVLIQAICTSLVFAYSIKYMKEKFNQKNIVSFIVLCIYAVFPVFVMSVQTISKDALSAWIFVLFVIQFVEIIRTNSSALKNKRFAMIFMFICLLCVLTKKVEIYVILLSLLGVLIFQKGNRLAVFMSIFVVSFVSFLIIPVIRSTFSIVPSGFQEMLSVPFQQTANYVKNYSADVTDDEREVLEKVLNYDDLGEKYDPTNADPVKGYAPKGADSDYKNYLGVWIRQGIKHPDAYLAATAAHFSGWYSFFIYKPLTDMQHHTQIDDNLISESVAERNGLFVETSGVFNSVYRFLYSIPIVGVLFTYAFFATIVPAFVVCTLIKKRKIFPMKYGLVIIPLLLSIVLGCYLSPVSIHIEGARYLYPIIYILPTCLMLIVSHYSEMTSKG